MTHLKFFVLILLFYYGACSQISQKKCREYAGFTRQQKEVENLTYEVLPLAGKVPVETGEFPHMVKLGFEHDKNDTRRITWACSGTLISDQFILTSAQCRKFGSSSILLGRNLQSREAIPANFELPPNENPVKFVKIGDKTKEEQILTVEEIILHPNFTAPYVYNDITLLKLNESVNFSTFIRPACLHEEEGDEDLTNETLIVTGWGLLGVGHYYSDHLMKLNLTAFNKKKCNEKLDIFKDHYFPEGLQSSQMCLGSYTESKALCPGDAGAPFQIKNKNQANMFDIYGIITFGYFCNFLNVPVVATKISPFIQWIESVIWNNSSLLN